MMGQLFLESTSSIVWVLGVILFVVQCAFSLTKLETIYRLRYENFEGKNLTDFYVASKPVLLLRVLSNVLQFVALLCLCLFPKPSWLRTRDTCQYLTNGSQWLW
jgi:hypothetical protein